MISDEQMLKDHLKIIQLITQGTQLETVLSTIIISVEKWLELSQIYTVIFRVDHTENKLVKLASSSLPENSKVPVPNMKIRPDEGSSGSAAYFKKPIVVSNIDNDKRWDNYRDIAEQSGFKASWSVPVISSKKDLLGVFTVYYQECYEPDKRTIQMVEGYSRLTAIAIELSNNLSLDSEIKVDSLQNRKNKQIENENTLSQLRRALVREEFEVYYQPYFGIRTNDFGVEALIRWNHPEKGLLPPVAFLDVAEASEFIIELEEWVLNRSIFEAKKLNQKGIHNLYLSVNISARQFENKDFPKLVTDILKKHSFSPEHLTLEITERFPMEQKNLEIMNELKNTGVRISIDDFGTSYSSLQYLRDLPIDELKIDRSFMSDIEWDVDSRKIVEMIIMLAHQLKLTIVAEGVETKGQLQFLKEMNCDRVQGYFFSKPIPLEEIIRKYGDNKLYSAKSDTSS